MTGLADRLGLLAAAASTRTRDRSGHALPIAFEAVLAPAGVLLRGTARINDQQAVHTFLISYQDLDLAGLDPGPAGLEIIEAALDGLAGQVTT